MNRAAQSLGRLGGLANYRILTADGRAKNAGTGRPSWFTLEEAKREYDPGAGEIIIEIDPGTGRKLWEVIP